MAYRALIVALFLLLLLPSQALAEALLVRVVGVQDGDTITVLTSENQSFRVRLVEIDAPESGQPYGQRAKQALSAMVFGKDVTVDVQGTDRYGRTLGRVYHGEFDVNAAMVRDGFAWAYRSYLIDDAMLSLEEDARREARGLWSLPAAERVPPWEWRRKRR
jgi:endonuclease YncB( thermonuclease family)